MNKTASSIILVGIALAVVFFLLLPRYEDFRRLNQTLESKKTELANNEAYIDHLRQLEREAQAHGEEFEKANAAIPEGDDVPNLFDFIQQASAESGLILESIQITGQEKENPESELVTTQTSFEVRGSYESLKTFLGSLESSPRLIEVEELSFSTAPSGANQAATEQAPRFFIDIKTYSY